GAHLLHELLSDPARRFLCLTRGGGDAIGAALRRYGLEREDIAGRAIALRGDLSAPGLGLSEGDRARIVAEAGAIIHCGAEVRHLSPYRALRAANVEGVKEVLRLACAAGAPLHHVSTLSAFAPGAAPLVETVAAADAPAPAGGYNLSKWVAERLVEEARVRGLPARIYRLGAVAGSSLTGAFNAADILGRRLQGYLAAGAAPAGEALLNILPVDYVARAILHLAGAPGAAGDVFHLTHSTAIPVGALFDACAAEGRPLRRLPPGEWRALLDRIAREDPSHPLHALAALGGAEGYAGETWPYACAATRAALGDGPPEPALNEALLRRYVRAFLDAGSIGAEAAT
ncbi:MAG: thioester reductase domain-containing protein, partial [Pikeienuella sp.]